MPQSRNPLSILTRQADGARFGLFATDDLGHPLLMAEQDEAGCFDLSTAERLSAAEAFDLLQQINGATNALN